MKLLNRIIDKLQELFPPNRIAIILAGTITAVSGSIAAWLAAHFPGLELGALEIAGVLTAALLITLRLLDRWFDRWQEGERIDYQGDLEGALDELVDGPDAQAFFQAIGTMQGVGDALADLRSRLEQGNINETEVRAAVASIGDLINALLLEHTDAVPVPPTPPVASPPADAAPPAAPQPAE